MAEEKRERTRLRDYPWKPIAANAAMVGGMTYAGHTAGGALADVLARHGPLKKRLQAMPREQRRKLFKGVGTALGAAAIPAAYGAQRLASDVHLWDSQRKWRKQDKKEQEEKTASVILVYEVALKGLL